VKEASIQCSGDKKTQRFQKRPKSLHSVADQTALADALSDVEPHQHLSGYQRVPQSILGGRDNEKVRELGMQPQTGRLLHSSLYLVYIWTWLIYIFLNFMHFYVSMFLLFNVRHQLHKKHLLVCKK